MRNIDLNIPYTGTSPLVDRLNTLLHLGYQVAAVNVECDCRSKGLATPHVTGAELRGELLTLEESLDTSLLKTEGLTYKQWTRVSYIVETKEQIEKVVADGRQPFDVVAACPLTRDALEDILAAKQADANFFHLVSIDPAVSIPDWVDDDDLIQKISTAGIPVEICYSGLISDTSVRSEALSKFRALFKSYAGGNLSVILSSHAEDKMNLRGPLDVASMLNLWDVPNELAIRCISGNPNDLLVRCLGPGDVGQLYTKPMIQLVHALGLRVRKTPHEGEGKRRRTKRRKKSN